jgi:hypothetical protein
LGHGSENENHRTPELKHNTHYTGIKFTNTTYLLPWSIHTIPPAALNHTKVVGELTSKGQKAVVTEFAQMFK